MSLSHQIGLFALWFGLLNAFSGSAQAVETVKSKPLLEIVDTVLAIHPQMQLARAKLDQARAESNARKQPLYNPQLEIDYESNVEDTATIGLSQTFDWSDKQGAYRQIGAQNLLSAEAKFVGIRQSIAATFLRKINNAQSAKMIAELNRQQLDTLQEFVNIAQQRFSVGDISQIELDLALLAAGEIRMSSAKIQANNFSAQLELTSFFNFEKRIVPSIEIDLIGNDSNSIENLLRQHPLLKQLKIASNAAKAGIKLAERQRSADPTLSINAGKDGDQSIVSLGFSMPLFVRNNFSAEVDAAIANSVAVEQDYLNAYREIFVAVKATKKSSALTLDAYQHWTQLSQSGLQKRAELLQKLWKSGDLETTDYLVQIQQTLDTRIAATQLKADVINAWIDFLLASGQIDDWLNLAVK